jgi:hypothetical protein
MATGATSLILLVLRIFLTILVLSGHSRLHSHLHPRNTGTIILTTPAIPIVIILAMGLCSHRRRRR